MNIVQVMREVARELRRVRMLSIDAIADPEGAVDLAMCVGSDCIKLHGIRVATWRGVGPCSIYIVCDECHVERLTADEREHMVELFGAAWVRHLGLHALHNGLSPDRAEQT